MIIREVRTGRLSEFAIEVKPGEWQVCGASVFRDNIHRMVLIRRRKIKGAVYLIYQTTNS